ncbi:MAG: hypothetical protein DRP34_04290 [Thermodesulfobacteriota bacterium]|nr:MAG: hypothetical protein DRP34_04290 [Thermodesulfobacteriota bacterium]
MSLLKKNTKSFTLIEALIAILLVSLIVISISSLITGSVFLTRKRIIYECLVNAANSAIEACRGGKNISSFNCGGLNIDININIDCSSITVPGNTWDVNCEDITVTARYGNTTHTLRDMVCKFGGA